MEPLDFLARPNRGRGVEPMRTFMKIHLAALALFVLWGCAILHPTDPYAPALVSPTPGSPVPLPDFPPQVGHSDLKGPMDLDRCVDIALRNNPEIAATTWEVSAAGFRIDQARAARWPSLSADSGYFHHLDNQRLIQARYNGEPGFFDTDIFRGDIILKIPLFTGGRIINEISASQILRKAEENRLSRTRDELIFNVSSTYYGILAQRKVIYSLEFSIQAMEEQLKKISDLLAVQKAARVDLLRTQVRLADLKQNLVREQNLLAIQKRLLANFMGLDYDSDRIDIEGKLSFEEITCDADLLTTEALRARPDFLATRARLEAQARRVDIARAAHYPNVSILGSYGIRANSLGDDEDVGSVGLGLTVPLFEGGRILARESEERSTLAAARERLRKLELQIRQEVETAVLDVRSSSERVKATQQAIDQGRESLRIERQKYELGLGSITDVLDAQSALLQSETNYYRALADFRTSVARIGLVTGGHAS